LDHPTVGIDAKKLAVQAGVAAALGALLTPVAAAICVHRSRTCEKQTVRGRDVAGRRRPSKLTLGFSARERLHVRRLPTVRPPILYVRAPTSFAPGASMTYHTPGDGYVYRRRNSWNGSSSFY